MYEWFQVGALMSLFHLVIWLGLGMVWWKLLGSFELGTMGPAVSYAESSMGRWACAFHSPH